VTWEAAEWVAASILTDRRRSGTPPWIASMSSGDDESDCTDDHSS